MQTINSSLEAKLSNTLDAIAAKFDLNLFMSNHLDVDGQLSTNILINTKQSVPLLKITLYTNKNGNTDLNGHVATSGPSCDINNLGNTAKDIEKAYNLAQSISGEHKDSILNILNAIMIDIANAENQTKNELQKTHIEIDEPTAVKIVDAMTNAVKEMSDEAGKFGRNPHHPAEATMRITKLTNTGDIRKANIYAELHLKTLFKIGHKNVSKTEFTKTLVGLWAPKDIPLELTKPTVKL